MALFWLYRCILDRIFLTQNLLRDRETLKVRLDKLEAKMEACHKEMFKVKGAQQGMIANIMEYVEKQKSQESSFCCARMTSRSEQYVWKLQDIRDVLERSEFIYSPVFRIAGVYGYSMQLFFKCWFKETFSVGFRLVMGEYDNSLTWPFKGQVQIRIMDQETGSKNMECLFTVQDLEMCPYAIRKPQKGETNAALYSENMDQSLLDDDANAYVRDDVILIRCDVDFFL